MATKVRAHLGAEAGDHSVNYADEVPPKWISTSKAEYTTKPIKLETEEIQNGDSVSGDYC
jgi:hypothetical protein